MHTVSSRDSSEKYIEKMLLTIFLIVSDVNCFHDMGFVSISSSISIKLIGKRNDILNDVLLREGHQL